MKTVYIVPLPAALLAITLALAPAAHAHVVLDQVSGVAGTYQKLVFRVGHGCDGSATKGVTVTLPESVTGAKPMPKAGWNITLVEGKLSVPVESHGRAVTSSVREVSWMGGPLPDAYFDEFVIQAKLPDQPGKLYFRVVQQCEKGSVAWDEIAADNGVMPKAPAPVFEVLPAGPSTAPHQH